jgi:hypothetical protein
LQLLDLPENYFARKLAKFEDSWNSPVLEVRNKESFSPNVLIETELFEVRIV